MEIDNKQIATGALIVLFLAGGAFLYTNWEEATVWADINIMGAEVVHLDDLDEEPQITVHDTFVRTSSLPIFATVQDSNINPGDTIEICGTVELEDDSADYAITSAYAVSGDYDIPHGGQGDGTGMTVPYNEPYEVCHDFGAPDSTGSYDVSLWISHGVGGTRIGSDSFTVEEETDPARARISAPNQVEVGETVTFDGSSSSGHNGIDHYEWWIDGGMSESTSSSFSHTFDEEGTYDIDLMVIDNAGQEDWQTHTIEVTYDDPEAGIDIPQTEIETGDTLEFTANPSSSGTNSIESYEWSVDGQSIGEGTTQSYTFDESGDKTVELEVTDTEGVTDTDSVTVNVLEPKELEPVVVIPNHVEPEEEFEMYLDEENSVIEAGLDEVRWDIGRDRAGVTGTEVTHTFRNEGTQSIEVEVIDQRGQSSTIEHTVDVSEDPGIITRIRSFFSNLF